MPPVTPRDVVIAALAVPIAPGEGHVERRAHLIVAALIEHGHLPGPDREVTEADLHHAAQFLADHSRHPRYMAVMDGWRKLLVSEADVNMAHAQAVKNSPQSEHDALGQCRGLLLAAIAPPAPRRASQGTTR